MTSKQISGIILIIGVGLLVASVLADTIGIGDDPGFGTQQKMGTIAGAVIVVLGLVVSRKAT